MAHKRKADELKTPMRNVSARSTASDPAAGLQAKVDWSTMDRHGEFDGFTLKAVAHRPKKASPHLAHKKQKTGSIADRSSSRYKEAPLGAAILQENPYRETDLSDVYCKIEPAREWESTRRYRKFTITGEEFEVSQFVFVKKEAEDHDTPNAIPYWIAKVLEVRAGDAQHVYLRIYWAYRPEDLPGGRQPHHGDCELIVSNHMDVIDALCVQGAANVVHWDDYPDSLTFPAPEQLYWRQSLDITKRKGSQLTKLNTYCLDEKPSNPDERLIQCPSCSGYLHAHCLEECAIDDALKEHNIAKTKVSGPKIQHQRKAFFEAEISTTDELRLTVTDKRKGQKDRHWDVDILCLLCNSIVAEAIAHLPAPTIPVGQSADDESEEGEEEEKKEEEEEEEEGEKISVVGDVPTSATVATTVPAAKAPVPEPQSRGLPKGTRKKERHRPPVTRIPVLHQGEKNLPSEECFLDMYHAHDGAKILDTQDLSAQTQTTPLSSALLPANMFQSSVRSVKRLLHWESLH